MCARLLPRSDTYRTRLLVLSVRDATRIWSKFYTALITRRRRRSKLARLYMDRLISLSRWPFPSTGLLLQPCCKAARTAASSQSRCLANEPRALCCAHSCHFVQAGKSHFRTAGAAPTGELLTIHGIHKALQRRLRCQSSPATGPQSSNIL